MNASCMLIASVKNGRADTAPVDDEIVTVACDVTIVEYLPELIELLVSV